jgi:hypothetical protein
MGRLCVRTEALAHAAAIGQVNPLADVDSRLLVGLPALGPA